MFRLMLSILFTLMLLVTAAPTYAVERVSPENLPVLAPLASARSHDVFTINGRTAGVGQYEYIYGETVESNAVHGVWQDLDQNGDTIRIYEDILYNGMFYQRINNEQRWKAANLGDPNQPISGDTVAFWSQLPLADPDDLIWTFVGETTVEGATTGQYQSEVIPGKNSRGVTVNKNDYFIGITDKFMHKQHTTLQFADAGQGAITMEYALVNFDFGMPVQIGAPHADLVDIVDAKMIAASVPGTERMSPWVRSHISRSLANDR